MTFLELAQRLRLESMVSGSGPSSVVGQVGELGELVAWINTAYQDIQLLHDDWRFMQSEFSFPTIANVNTYTPAAVSLTALAEWLVGDLRCYLSLGDENPMLYEGWGEFRAVRDLGDVTTGRPTHFSVKPDNSLILWPTPDQIYTVRGEYIIVPDVLSGNTDEPIIPARFHMIIVWRALIYYGAALAADEKLAHGRNEYTRLMRALRASQGQ
ncbi:MAG: hypothetical protein ABIK07_14265, partial [Planctomycetota bacterium]